MPSLGNFVEGTASTSWNDTKNDGGGLYYKVTAVDDADNESDPASPGTTTTVPIQGIPTSFALHQNVPNPFNPTTTSATWDGRNNAGQPVAASAYFYRLTALGFTQTMKMVLLK